MTRKDKTYLPEKPSKAEIKSPRRRTKSNDEKNPRLKACILFDHGESARHAKSLVKRVTWGATCDLYLLRIAELCMLAVLHSTAYAARDVDLIVVAVGDNVEAPSEVKSWLGLCLSFRDADRKAPLVAFATSRTALARWTGRPAWKGFSSTSARRALASAG